MGRVRNSDQVPHRAGPLVQDNKRHKAGKHRTKGMLDTETRGKSKIGLSVNCQVSSSRNQFLMFQEANNNIDSCLFSQF